MECELDDILKVYKDLPEEMRYTMMSRLKIKWENTLEDKDMR